MTQERAGVVVLNVAQLDYEIDRRGLNSLQLAEAAGVTPLTVSRARAGGRILPGTAKKIADALTRIPTSASTDLLLFPPGDRKSSNGHGPQPRIVPSRRLRPLRPNEGLPPEFVGNLRVIDVSDKPSRKQAVAASP